MSEVEALWAAVSEVLLRQPGLTPAKVSRAVLDASNEELSDWRNISEWASQFAPSPVSVSALEMQAERAIASAAIGIQAISIRSLRYPDSLRLIEDPPPVLYARGNVDLLKDPPGVAVVGTRKASRAGIVIAQRISAFFAERGWTIVSGLAMGIDAAAHRGTLDVAGKTIAVLAHGLKSASPKANALLGDEILHNGGTWVSEHPLDVPARPEQFVLRNRIQIGLCAGSIIVEGEEYSGTMTQAEFCIRNKRNLFAVFPATAEALKLVSQGPLILINKRGATALRSKDDYESALQRMVHTRKQLQASSMPSKHA